MTTEIKSTQTARWLSDGTPRSLPHELHNWVNSRKRGGGAPRGSGTFNNNSADDGV